MAGTGQFNWSPMSPPSPTGIVFSKSATVSDFRRLSRRLTPEPSPQAWLASSKRRVGVLDPPASPLEMFSPITGPLDASQWNKRMSLLTHRYLIEYGIDREEEVVEKAFRTLELFCVGNVAKYSLEKFKLTFTRLSTTSLEQRNSNPPERSGSWISFSSFLDEPFTLSHTSLSLEQQPLDTSTLSDITQDTNYRRPRMLSPTSIKHSSFRTLEKTRSQNPESNTTMSGAPRPRYITPTIASKAQTGMLQPQRRPTTPASAGSATEKGNWMANAGRRLGITTPKSRREGRVPESSSADRLSRNEVTTMPSKSQVNDRIKKVQVQKAAESLGPDVKYDPSNIQARLNRQGEYTAPPKLQSGIPRPLPKRSPPEKPLPSLPVATIRSRSPIVRRSLIDASEKPLRKSLSPPPSVEAHEIWPAIEPSRSTSPNILGSRTVNCSVHSVTIDQQQRESSPLRGQGSPEEEIYDDKPVKARDNCSSDGSPALCGSYLGVASVSDTALVNAVEQATEAGGTHAGTCIGDVLAGAASVEHNAPNQHTHPERQPRQTRTSLMRARLSSGSNHVPEKESKIDKKVTPLHHSSPPRNNSTANANAIPKRLSAPGPVRSRPRSRRAVPARNSPYGQGNRVTGQVVKSHFNTSRLPLSPGRGKPFSRGALGGLADLTAVKQITASGMSTRRTQIPVRHQSKDSQPEESEPDIHIKKSDSYVNGNDEDRNFRRSEDADIDIDRKASSVRYDATSKNADIIQAGKMDTANEAEFTNLDSYSSPTQHGSGSATNAQAEILPSTTPLPSTAFVEDINLSPNSPNDSDVLSLRDFAATEPLNYRIKRLSLAAPEHGPTLRISEDAEMILMGTHSKEGRMGDERQTSKNSSRSDLQMSAVIKEQFKTSKGKLLKGQLPISRSTTSRSLSKFDTETNLSRAAAPSTGDVGMTRANNATTGSELNDSRLARSIVGEDPFVHDERLPLAGRVTEDCVPKDEQWPLGCAETPHSDLKTVSERQSEEEDSWISPLANEVAQKNEGIGRSTFKALDKTLAIYDLQDLQQPSKGVREMQNCMKAAAKTPDANDDTTSVEGHGRPLFPARISSRTQFRDLIQERSEKGRPVSSRQFTSPEIPNRFASVRSTNQSKVISAPLASVTRLENVRRSDFNVSSNGLSSLRQRSAPNSANAEVSATKGMLSNFRGLFHKRSLENTDAASVVNNNGSVRRKNALFSNNGSLFPTTSTPVTSKPLSTGPSRRNARVTPTLSGIGADRAIYSTSPAFITPGSGETQHAERLAVQVLDSALVETNAQTRAKLGQLGQFMVHAVTAAKDAEKAVEEARQAAATAEVHSIDAKRCLWHVSELVEAMLKD